jgi:hypothetical protein
MIRSIDTCQVLTLRTRMESEFGSRDRRIDELQKERAELRGDTSELRSEGGGESMADSRGVDGPSFS